MDGRPRLFKPRDLAKLIFGIGAGYHAEQDCWLLRLIVKLKLVTWHSQLAVTMVDALLTVMPARSDKHIMNF